MPAPITLETPRLHLRQWIPADCETWVALNDDPHVMEHFPKHLTTDESLGSMGRIETAIATQGRRLWAAERRDTGAYIGFIGLQRPGFDPFLDDVEVGWRLAHEHWGNGFAPEGARAALDFAFATLGLERVISMTSAPNTRSMRVMEKLGMTRVAGADFDHPRVPEGHRLRRHVMYALERPA